ncbi:MAG TPA: hypothetical protein VJN43_23905 [Bryobacteraceae bacterium]|nr:hypothetical protein [Bryobacteraceae bacterium]
MPHPSIAISIYIQAQKADNPSMKATPDARAGLKSTQETVQTALLVIVTFVGTWLALYRVPWQVSADPCVIAAAGSGVVVTCLWLTRWRGLAIFERNLLAGFLVAMPLVYVARYLFASASSAPSYWLWVEILGTAIFVALAVLGVKRSPWFLAIGMALHGLTWDSWHYRNSTYIPDWYVIACLAVDLAFAAYMVARVPAYQRASRMETEN